jgi:3-oxoacyl-[acyl-carrier protein] reductase
MASSEKVALITGGAGDIGLAVSAELASQKIQILLLDIAHQKSRLVDAMQKMPKTNVGIKSFEADVRVTAEVEQVFQQIDKLDYLINCAGIIRRAQLRDLSDEDLDATLDINLKGTFKTCRAAARLMSQQKSGSIINIASGLAAHPGALYGAYGASKAGVIALSKALALELAPFNVTVNCVAPGMVDTRFIDEWTEEQRAAYLAKIPLNRLATAQDVANIVSFLCSEQANYLTGQVIWLNGGAYMP